jgi:hypothetical protein
MILTIVLGLLTTVLGVMFGCTVLELAVRVLGHSLSSPQTNELFRSAVPTSLKNERFGQRYGGI